MKIEKLKYSNRSGYSVEISSTSSFTLTPDEVFILTILLKAQLSQDDLDTHFSEDEQKVLHRYETLVADRRADLSKTYSHYPGLKRFKRELREMLTLWAEFLPQGAYAVMQKILGWQLQELAGEEEGTFLDRLLLRGLKEGRMDKYYFLCWLKDRDPSEVSEEVIAQLKERFGPLDWPSRESISVQSKTI